MSIDREGYLAAYNLLATDFRHLWAYVEPTDANLTTHSHRLYELLLRACTEVESMCKDLMVEHKAPKPGDSMKDYCWLEGVLVLEPDVVQLDFWKPTPRRLTPFKDWSTTRLPWYQGYNNVKHNRLANFKDASLANVGEAMAALFLLLVKGIFNADHHVTCWGAQTVAGISGKVNQLGMHAKDGFYPFTVFEPV